MNSVIYSDTGGYQGVSFAIPIDVAMDVARELRAHGKVTRGRIGVRLQEVSAELAKAFKSAARLGRARGRRIQGRSGGTRRDPPGDVVVRFGGKPVETDADLVRLTAAAKPGTTLDVRARALRRAAHGASARRRSAPERDGRPPCRRSPSASSSACSSRRSPRAAARAAARRRRRDGRDARGKTQAGPACCAATSSFGEAVDRSPTPRRSARSSTPPAKAPL